MKARKVSCPKLSEDIFSKHRAFSESFTLKETSLPKEYEGLDGYLQAELDNMLLAEAKFEENNN